jgi:hypothetical protein
VQVIAPREALSVLIGHSAVRDKENKNDRKLKQSPAKHSQLVFAVRRKLHAFGTHVLRTC